MQRNVRKDILESFDVRTIKVEQAGANSYSIIFMVVMLKQIAHICRKHLQHRLIELIWHYHQNGIKQWKIEVGTTIFAGEYDYNCNLVHDVLACKTNMGSKPEYKFN